MKISLSELIRDKKSQAISCPLEVENTRIIEGKCLYFTKHAERRTTALKYCEAIVFGPNSTGTFYQPSSKVEHNKVVEEAEKIYSGIKGQLIFKHIFILTI